MTSDSAARLSLVARLVRGVAGDLGAGATVSAVQAPRGPVGAVDDLVAAHADAVYRYALRLARTPHQAQDLTQETLLRALRRRGKLREPAAARVWLLKIATNLHRDGLRAARPVTRLAGDEADWRPGVGERLAQQESVTRALAALDELPQRQRQAMHLVTIEGLSHNDAAAVLGISLDALKSSLSLARRRMREKLKDIYEEMRGTRSYE